MTDDVIKNIIRVLATPFILATTLIFLAVYLLIGTSFWMVMFIRLLVIYNIKIIRSVWNNSNEAANTLDSIVNFTKKHFQLLYEIIKIPMYIWQSPKDSPTQIRDIFEDELEILKKNVWLSIGVFVSLIIGFVFVFVSLGPLFVQKTKNKDVEQSKVLQNEVVSNSKYKVGMLGEDTRYYNDDTGYINAIKISSLIDGMPAKNAGLKIGDIIYKIDELKIENMESFIEVINNSRGREMKINYIRYGVSNSIYMSAIPQ